MTPSAAVFDVWRVGLEQYAETVERLKSLLADDELTTAARYHFPVHRRRSVVRRAALRTILAEYAGAGPAELRFVYGPQGKPALAETTAAVHFNVSHSGELALVAVGQQPLGVDLEQWREVADADLVARRFFTPNEVAAQRAAPDGNQLFLRHWTRKEAVIKAVGRGLSMPLNTFDVSAIDAGQIVRIDEPGGEQRWNVHDLAPAEGYLAALASAGPIEHVRWRDWTAS
ncbi:MAG TPA: 4'-phosphopantetheinyl transferase superfamily protein [Pirellulales bacterium]|nr:4'-phosphopantetheinyl transferase superfamily protein [Pirellulales bacterium]